MSAVATIAGRQSQVPAGTRLGRFIVLRRLASGGMSEVYLARAEGEGGFAKPVALKLMLPHLVEEDGFTTMLEREAKLAAHLNHPNIVQTFELGREADELFIAMEYVHGRTLREILAGTDGPLPLPCALAIAAATCTALHTAHCATGARGEVLGVLHRDVSPANVIVRQDGVVKVVDFGIAKAMTETTMTRTGTLKGKAGYMSPEQCRGDELTPASDIFNLGILLYEMTTGHRAFPGSNIFESMNRIIDGRYRAPKRIVEAYPLELSELIAEVLSPDPADRPVSALTLRQRIESLAASSGFVLSELDLAGWVEERFGTMPAVDLSLDTDVVSRSRRRKRRPYVGLVAAAVGGGALTAAVFVMLGAGTAAVEPATRQTPAAAPVEAPAPAVRETQPQRAEPERVAPDPEATPAPAPPPAEEPVGPEQTEPEPREEPAPASKPRRRSGRTKPKRAPARKNADPLFPWRN